MVRKISLYITLIIAVTGVISISAQDESRLNVVATTSIIADVARNIGGNLVSVTSIIPVGADSHGYTPSPRDVITIVEADVVLVNGMDLEEELLDVIESNASAEPVVVSNGVRVLARSHNDDHDLDEDHEGEEHEHDEPYIGVLGDDVMCDNGHHRDEDEADEDRHDHGECDPHVWYDPANVMIWAQNIADALSAASPDNAATYAANAEMYIAQLEELQAEIEMMVAEIPQEERILITNHDFLAYFAVPYGFEVIGTVIPAATTIAEVTPRSIITLAGLIEETGARAIFAEYTTSIDMAEAVAREIGHEVAVVRLFSGSLSPEDGPAATYLDYMRYNAEAIVTALMP